MLSVWSASASAACALPLLLLATSTAAKASPVAIDSSTAFSINAFSMIKPGSGTGDYQSDSKTGGLANPHASVMTSAHLPVGNQSERSVSASAAVTLLPSSDGFEFKGETTAVTFPDSIFEDDSHGEAVASIEVPFTLNAGGGKFQYSFAFNGLGPDHENIKLLLNRKGDSAPLINEEFYRLEDSPTELLGAGSYDLRVISQSQAEEALQQDMPAENGSAQFDVSLTGGGVVIPLPNPFAAGAIMLCGVFGGLRIFRRRIQSS